MKLKTINEYNDDTVTKINNLIKTGDVTNIELALYLDQSANDGKMTAIYNKLFPNVSDVNKLAKLIAGDVYDTEHLKDDNVVLPILPKAYKLIMSNSYKTVDSSNLPNLSFIEIYNNSKIGKYIHGGRNIHEIFIHQNSFLEDVSIGNTNVLYKLRLSRGGGISSKALDKLSNVMELSISTTNIKTIKSKFPRLAELRIVKCDIDFVDFDKMPKLEDVEIAFTNLKEITLNGKSDYGVLSFEFNDKLKTINVPNAKYIEMLQIRESSKRKTPLIVNVSSNIIDQTIEGNIIIKK